MPAWVDAGFEDFNKRLPDDFRLHLQALPLAKRNKNTSGASLSEREGESMLSLIRSSDYVVALDVPGRQRTTKELAEHLESLRMAGRDLVLLIGGPDGLGKNCLERADESWSLSRLTMPHGLARLVLAEQIYRCWSLLQNHPYHRE